jgi:rhodanese-related sulfurtransferase/rubrerythrin
MGFLDYLRPVSCWSAEKAREFLASHDPDSFNLLDVRTRAEYDEAHIPGALSTPLVQLPGMLGKLDRGKPTLAYCAVGVRSRSAVAILTRAGFREAHSLAGGIQAWDGHRTDPYPASSMTILSGAESLPELLALAWYMEDGARRFYTDVAGNTENKYAAWSFKEIAADEEKHGEAVRDLAVKMIDRSERSPFPQSILPDGSDRMEGGLPVHKALEWARNRQPREIAEMAMAWEANAYDLHVNMERQTGDADAKTVFRTIAREEMGHLNTMQRLFRGELGEELS